jgi:hypothetical protein
MATLRFPFTPDEIKAAEEQIVEQSKKIDYYLTEYTIELLANKMRNGDFVVPDYQRAYTWEEPRKWRFIESILMNLPIPFLFFWEDPQSGKLEIVDGSQRLRTIEEFILGGLELGELERLTNVSRFTFSELTEARQRKIKNRSIRGIVLNEHADEQARLDLFERINTGSKVANKAEIRRGALKGPFISLVIELANDPLFIELAPAPEKAEKERLREELVTRFFAYGDGLDDYVDEVGPFLFAYARRMNEVFNADPSKIEEYRKRFQAVMSFVNTYFPFGFRKTAKGTATPRARFEAIAIGSYIALSHQPNLKPNPEQIKEWLSSQSFAEVTGSDGANAIAKLTGRISYVANHLEQ